MAKKRKTRPAIKIPALQKSVKKIAPTGIAIDKAEIAKTYEHNFHKYQALLEEAVFVLKDRLEAADIKLHAIEQRVKTLDSLIEKCERHACGRPFVEFHDIAGARVICLFKNDLEIIEKLIKTNFDVVEIDDKRLGESAPLGYMSVHYVCRMPDRYKGPRYDQTRDITFEIQVRTLCMHCWAAVSHYIDYKGDWDVPRELKTALSALSGLFYVADNEFQQFYLTRQNSLQTIEAEPVSALTADRDVNLDTIRAYLGLRFPERARTDKSDMSDLVQQLKSAGYAQLSHVDRDVLAGIPLMKKYEEKLRSRKSTRPYLTQTGAARIAIRSLSEAFAREIDVSTGNLPQ